MNQVITESLVNTLQSFEKLIGDIDYSKAKTNIFSQSSDWVDLTDCYFNEVQAVDNWEDFVTKAIKENKVHLINTLIHEAKNILRQVV